MSQLGTFPGCRILSYQCRILSQDIVHIIIVPSIVETYTTQQYQIEGMGVLAPKQVGQIHQQVCIGCIVVVVIVGSIEITL